MALLHDYTYIIAVGYKKFNLIFAGYDASLISPSTSGSGNNFSLESSSVTDDSSNSRTSGEDEHTPFRNHKRKLPTSVGIGELVQEMKRANRAAEESDRKALEIQNMQMQLNVKILELLSKD